MKGADSKLEIGETLAALAIIAIAFGIAGLTALMKLIGHLLGAH